MKTEYFILLHRKNSFLHHRSRGICFEGSFLRWQPEIRRKRTTINHFTTPTKARFGPQINLEPSTVNAVLTDFIL